SSRRRHTRFSRDWSSDVCSSDLSGVAEELERALTEASPVTVERHVPALDEWLELRVYPTHEGLAIHLRDVTELRRHREVLHASEDRKSGGKGKSVDIEGADRAVR